MRLICGVMQLDGTAADAGLLRAMAAQMQTAQARPSVRFWQEGPAGFGLLDFSPRADAVPSLPESAVSVMLADARLDQPAAVAASYDCAASAADDALLLAAMERGGEAALGDVLGDFAFAHWSRAARRLTCGRDIFGIRPLVYVYRPGQMFAFASLAKALYGAGITAKEIDERALTRRLMHDWRHDDSLIAGIKRLPPGHVIAVSDEGLTLSRYWQFDRAAVGTRRCTPDEAAREMRRLVDEAVRCRLPRAGETGAHLSGGLDSSAVAVLAGRHLRAQGRTLHAYSFLDRLRNDASLEDESAFVRAVLDQEPGIDWTPIRPPAALLRGETFDPDTATALGNEDPENALCARAAEQGVGLILSGWGGDEAATFNGRGALAELFLRGRWRRLGREITALSRERGWPKARIFRGEVLSYVWRSVLPRRIIDGARTLAGRAPTMRALRRMAISSEQRDVVAGPGRPSAMVADACENRWRLVTSPHIAARAEVWAQTGARYGVAFAFPLLDRRVVEFALSLPSDLFLRDGFRRRPFRDAMTDVLPPAVRLRHQKYQASPGRMIDIAESKDELLAKLDTFEKNESVRRVIDLAQLRRQIESFPSPERVREQMRGNDNPEAAHTMLAALQAFGAAAYLAQNGSE